MVARRNFNGSELVIASHNKGKLFEFSELLKPFGVTTYSAGDKGVEEPEETGLTFAENALLKAHVSALHTGLPALADDTGLVVPALDGAPGIYSARWAGPDRDFQYAMQKVHNQIGDQDRSAHFVCCLALVWPDGHEEVFEGRSHGHLVWPKRGTGGHGYDPMFQPNGDTRTYGEMTLEEKNVTSHRSKACEMLLQGCFSA